MFVVLNLQDATSTSTILIFVRLYVPASAMREHNTPYDEAEDPEIVGFFWKNN